MSKNLFQVAVFAVLSDVPQDEEGMKESVKLLLEDDFEDEGDDITVIDVKIHVLVRDGANVTVLSVILLEADTHDYDAESMIERFATALDAADEVSEWDARGGDRHVVVVNEDEDEEDAKEHARVFLADLVKEEGDVVDAADLPDAEEEPVEGEAEEA